MSIFESIESGFNKFGLMTGEGADKKRMVIGALTTGFILTYLKPDLMFHEGEVRPWNWMESDEGKHPTSFTLWHAMIVGAVAFGVFI